MYIYIDQLMPEFNFNEVIILFSVRIILLINPYLILFKKIINYKFKIMSLMSIETYL